MLCENCGKNEANVRYTENINGNVRELHLCEECSKKLGIGEMSFNMPIDFSDFLSGFMDGFMEPEFMPMINGIRSTKCKTCGTVFDDVLNTGILGCGDCFATFEDKLDPIIKKIQGANRHVGRLAKEIDNKIDNKKNSKREIVNKETKEENTDIKNIEQNQEKIEELQIKLKEAIKEERYEDAAKIRDEIKKLEK